MNSEPLFEPDPEFAAEWSVEDPLAQGALKHGSVLVLDSLEEALLEVNSPEPDLGDFSPLSIFPVSVRLALTPLLIEKMRAAAIIVGWKLGQQGTPIRPGCIAEELALELIRREAVSALELIDAPKTAIEATRGVFEVCEDDDVLDLFEMQEPADAALALSSPINIQMGKADMRIEQWFKPFYGGRNGCSPHAFYLEPATQMANSSDRPDLVVISPEKPPRIDHGEDSGEFRVSIRLWEGAEPDPMPAQWLYYVRAPTPEAARLVVLDKFPEGAVQHSVVGPDGEEPSLAQADLSRISIDVQRLGLSQDSKEGSSFHLVGELPAEFPQERLPQLAGYLDAIFPVSILTRDGDGTLFGVTVNAESHEEAEADLQDAVTAFASSIGFDGDPFCSSSSGHGARDRTELLAEIRKYRPLR